MQITSNTVTLQEWGEKTGQALTKPNHDSLTNHLAKTARLPQKKRALNPALFSGCPEVYEVLCGTWKPCSRDQGHQQWTLYLQSIIEMCFFVGMIRKLTLF